MPTSPAGVRLSAVSGLIVERSGMQWISQGSPAAGQRVFRGVYEHHIDAKGRTSLPAKLRETLVGAYDERLIVTTALDPCLHAYPVREWERLEASLADPEPDGAGGEDADAALRGAGPGVPARQAGPAPDPAHAARPRRAGEGRGLGGDGEGHRAVEPGRLAQGAGGRARVPPTRPTSCACSPSCAREGSNRDQGGEEGTGKSRLEPSLRLQAHHPRPAWASWTATRSAPSATGCCGSSTRAASGWCSTSAT